MIKKHFLFGLQIALLLFGNSLKGQSFQEDLKFSGYLTLTQRYDEALFILKGNLKVSGLNYSLPQLDSMHYSIGWNYYMLVKLDSAASYLNRVSNTSDYYLKSRFYTSFCYSYLGNYNKADSLLKATNVTQEADLAKLKNFQQAGYALLKRDYRAFEEKSQHFDSSFYAISNAERDFKEYYQDLRKLKRKSPLLAGVLSAVVPGTGKFYAGYKGQAMGTFLPCLLLGAVATENYVKDGYKSPNFIVFASLFSVFYVGNVWGSVFSVKAKFDESNHEINKSILLDLHIPLRRVFD